MKDESSPKKPEGRKLTGPEKAAVFLALVGEDAASVLAAELSERELVSLRQGIHRMRNIESEHVDQVFEDACRQLNKANIMPEGMTDYLQRVLSKAMGPEKAAAIVGRIFGDVDDFQGVEALHEMDGKILANFLQEEHPQTIAFILAHLYPNHAGEILGLLPEDKQKEVAYRITRLGATSPGIIEDVVMVLRNEIRQLRGKQMGGVKPIAEILNYVDTATEERILAGFGEMDPQMAEDVRRLMFTFEDLTKIDDQSMQTLIREVEKDKWVVGLRTASPNLKKKVFGNMSERAGTILREEMESIGPVRLRDVETAQREILDFARKLESEGKVVLTTGKGKEDVLV